MNMPDEIWMHVQNGTLSCHTTPINSASVAFVPLLRAAKAEARIAALEAALGWAQTAASDWKRLAFDLVRAAGGTQRISMLTAMNAHTEDTLEAHQDHETGDMVYRVYRATQRPMPLTATELPLSARVEAKIARECFANEPGPTQGETHADPAIAAAVRRTSLETEAEQVKCLHPLHHNWHDRKQDCVHPMARSEFTSKSSAFHPETTRTDFASAKAGKQGRN